MKLDKRLFNTDRHIILIALYIPPYGTRYSSVELFDALSDDILNYSNEEYCHLICGDLNAHTGARPDIVTFDPTLCNCLDIDVDTRNRLEVTQTLESLGIPIWRRPFGGAQKQLVHFQWYIELGPMQTQERQQQQTVH